MCIYARRGGDEQRDTAAVRFYYYFCVANVIVVWVFLFIYTPKRLHSLPQFSRNSYRVHIHIRTTIVHVLSNGVTTWFLSFFFFHKTGIPRVFCGRVDENLSHENVIFFFLYIWETDIRGNFQRLYIYIYITMIFFLPSPSPKHHRYKSLWI
jgi:hypothetical protein